MDYNAYDLLQLEVNGTPIDARPIEFDGTPEADVLVKPIKISTVCPDCGQGLEFDVDLGDPPFGVLEFDCEYCNPGPVAPKDPFMNPLESGRVGHHELDPLLHDPNKQVVSNDGKSVAERIQDTSAVILPEGPEGLTGDPGEETPSNVEAPVGSPEKPKESLGDVSGLAVEEVKGSVVPKEMVDPAEGMGDEEDFDDDDLVETE